MTQGLRGAMRAGFANMNDVTVIQASQGLSLYVEMTIPDAKKKGVVVGYDGRHHSFDFAQLTAATFEKLGFQVYLFRKIVPTPFVVRHWFFITSSFAEIDQTSVPPTPPPPRPSVSSPRKLPSV